MAENRKSEKQEKKTKEVKMEQLGYIWRMNPGKTSIREQFLFMLHKRRTK